MERASRTRMFSSRKKPTYAAKVHAEGPRSCNDTCRTSARLSLWVSAITSSSELEHSKRDSNTMERRARDLARMDLELLLNLVRSETRPTSATSSRHPSRTANAKTFSDAPVRCRRQASVDSNHCGEYFPYAQLTMALWKPNTTPERT